MNVKNERPQFKFVLKVKDMFKAASIIYRFISLVKIKTTKIYKIKYYTSNRPILCRVKYNPTFNV